MEPDRRIRRIAIVGGGIAGWTAAATLARKLGGHCSIHVVDTAEPAAAGLAEATQPAGARAAAFPRHRPERLHRQDPVDLQPRHALRRLGRAPGETFWHPFGAFGALIERRPFYHFWHKARALGLKPRLELFSLETSMALANRFIFPTNSLGVAQHMRYALHMDARAARRVTCARVAERAGVIRLERKVVSATRREDGFLDELQVRGRRQAARRPVHRLHAVRARQLIGEILGTPFEDWKQWLPCDRIVSAPGALDDARPPYVRITARAAGWQWRMPLQHGRQLSARSIRARIQDDDAARAGAASRPRAQLLAEPRAGAVHQRPPPQVSGTRTSWRWAHAAGCARAARRRRPAPAQQRAVQPARSLSRQAV